MSGLHVDSLTKQLGLRQVLSDVFISCQQGDVLGLLGRNGSGKSTLLKIIFGSLKADHKFVKVDNKHIENLYHSSNLIQYLPQDGFLPNHIKIKNIISVFCTKPQAARLFEVDLIKPLLHKKSKELSGGEKKVVEILIMIYAEAKYLLLDEPFNGLAPLYIEIIKSLIRKYSSEKGFVITGHDYANVLDLSTSIILLHEGATKKIKNQQELIDFGYLPSSSLIS